jgi:hypothetical protein
MRAIQNPMIRKTAAPSWKGETMKLGIIGTVVLTFVAVWCQPIDC